MDWLRELGRRIGMLLHRRQFRADLEEEMQLHLDLRQQQQVEQGMSLNEAGFAARRRFGSPRHNESDMMHAAHRRI